MVWVPEGVFHNGQKYDLVSLSHAGTSDKFLEVLLAKLTESLSSPGTEDPVVIRMDYHNTDDATLLDKTFGAAFAFSSRFKDTVEQSPVLFSSNNGAIIQITWEDGIAGTAPVVFDYEILSKSVVTTNNDGGACLDALFPKLGPVSVVPAACNLTNPDASGSEMVVTVANVYPDTKLYTIEIDVNDKRITEASLDGTAVPSLPDPWVVTIPANSNAQIRAPLLWDDTWDVVVYLNGTKVTFFPTGGTLNSEMCGGEPV